MDGCEINPASIYKIETTIDGVLRPALNFKFYNDFPLEALNLLFTKDNCKKIIITENNLQYIHEDYSIRTKLAMELENIEDKNGNFISKEVINIVMAKRTTLEIQNEELIESLKMVQLAMCEIYENNTSDNHMYMSLIYTKFILEHLKRFCDLPISIKEQVKQNLINLNAPEGLYYEPNK